MRQTERALKETHQLRGLNLMKVTDCAHIAGITLLTLSDELPKGPWKHIIVDEKSFEPLVPMYAGDISCVKNNSVGIRGEHDFTGKQIEFA